MSTTRFKELWVKYNAGTLLPEEHIVFEDLLLSVSEEDISKAVNQTIEVDMNASYASDMVFEQITERIGQVSNRRTAWIRYAVAASVLIIGSLFLLKNYWSNGEVSKLVVANSATNEASHDIFLSDSGHATLSLPSGERYSLTDSMVRLETDAVSIRPLSQGVYAFEVKGDENGSEVFHVFETPKGLSNQLLLADGTKVWLNAMSTLEVSSHYGGKGKRQVRLVGEAYFEVARNVERPFLVRTGETTVQVLGTSFNVQARPKRKRVEATLVEGSVRVQNERDRMILSPGEQAYAVFDKPGIRKRRVDINQVLSWKNGYFNFINSSMDEILEELAEWYDIEYIEWNKVSKERFTLSLARTRSLAELLNKIELISAVKFTIKERRIIVN